MVLRRVVEDGLNWTSRCDVFLDQTRSGGAGFHWRRGRRAADVTSRHHQIISSLFLNLTVLKSNLVKVLIYLLGYSISSRKNILLPIVFYSGPIREVKFGRSGGTMALKVKDDLRLFGYSRLNIYRHFPPKMPVLWIKTL